MLSFCIAVKDRSRVLVDDHELLLLPNCIRSIRAAVVELGTVDDCEIVITDWASEDWPLAEWLEEAAHPLRVRVVQTQGPFSRGRGLNLAAAAAQGDVLFFTDADVAVGTQLLVALERHVSTGHAFFPVLFSYDDATHNTGWWRHTGFGNCAIARADYEAAGGWPEYTRWGREDDDFHERVTAVCDVIREEVRGFFHQWHPEDILWKDRYGERDPAEIEEILLARQVMDDVEDVIPQNAPLILADESRFGVDNIHGRPAFPFMESNGEYAGVPADDATAIAELERLRAAGASYLVVAWLTYWWFDHYPEFTAHVLSRYPTVMSTDRVKVFSLGPVRA